MRFWRRTGKKIEADVSFRSDLDNQWLVYRRPGAPLRKNQTVHHLIVYAKPKTARIFCWR
jgi:hypothetical protein